MQTSVSRNTLHKISHKIVKMLMLTNRQRETDIPKLMISVLQLIVVKARNIRG